MILQPLGFNIYTIISKDKIFLLLVYHNLGGGRALRLYQARLDLLQYSRV